jgi:hypothetical protein
LFDNPQEFQRKDIRTKNLPAVIVARGESPPQYPNYDEED